MGYPFPEINSDHIYKKTFLKDVSVFVEFETDDFKSIDPEAFADYLKSEFGIIPKDILDVMIPLPQSVVTEDEKILFSFDRNTVELKIKFPVYNRFSVLLSFLPKVTKYLDVCKASQLKNVRITKFNELHYSSNSHDFVIENAMNGIFDSKLQQWDKFKTPCFSNLPRWERKVTFEDDSKRQSVSMIYGYSQDDANIKRGSLTLKTIVDSTEKISPQNLKNQLEDLNILADRAFRWSVTDEIIKNMDSHE